MRGIRIFGFLALLPSAAVSGAVAADPPAAAAPLLTVAVEKGITYSTPDGESLKLDVAIPKEGGPYPAVVCLHGGAWQYGSRAELSRSGKDKNGKPVPSVIETIAAHGYVAASVGYRLAPKHKFPAQLEDVRAAVRFLRANAKKYNIDPDKVSAAGFSAGGHLALLLGLTDPAVELDSTDPSERVQCVVSFFGPTDLSLYSATPGLEDAYMVPLLGKACKTDPAVYRRASPIDHVSKNAPPVLMVHGTADLIVPIIHSERLQKKLQKAGATAELITVKGEGHGWGGPTASKTTRDVLQFLDQHLKKKDKK